MKRFLTESVLPVGGVAVAITALTLALFQVPWEPAVAVAGLRVPASAAPIPSSRIAREQLNDTLTRVIRTLDDGRRQAELPPPPKKPEPQSTAVATAKAAPAPTAPTGLSTALPAFTAPATTAQTAAAAKLLDATSSLAAAVKAIHEARTEEDIVRAEEMVRSAREQMQANCATTPGPLCESAEQIRSLGY